MKLCNSEAMKMIKELETQKSLVIFTETNKSKISYKEGEEKQRTKYDYEKTRKEIANLDTQIRKIKHELAVANCTVKIDEFDITIGEALVYLAQLNAEYNRLDTLSENEKISRRVTYNGVVEYTECMFDPDKAERDQKALYSKICKLQVCIDRANLTNYIEI